MTAHRFFWLALLLLASLLGCGGCVHGSGPYRPARLSGEEAALTLYRPRSLLSPGAVDVVVDQTDVGRLRRNTHLTVIVPPGEHLVRVERRSDATRLVRLGPGESLLLEVGAALLGGNVSLSDPGPEVAAQRVGRTRAVEPAVRLTGEAAPAR